MSLPAQTATVEASREAILAAIGDPPDLTLVRTAGNLGDHLIWAGTRSLLAERIYTETTLEGLCVARGHTVLLCGGGAFCRPYHGIMPRALAVAEMRFERVLVLPSSFDPSEDSVREALARTRATVFARERESYARIQSLCDARLAHDAAFFFDYDPYRQPGAGTLNAFRTDREALPGAALTRPADNDDISVTAPDLEAWLAAIANHRRVRTDRAHVMIAAALLGKQVEFAPSAYHKVPAIAEYALVDYPVRPLRVPDRAGRRPSDGNGNGSERAPARPRQRTARPGPVSSGVDAVVLTRGEPQRALRAVDSLGAGDLSPRVLVLDNNSDRLAARELAEACAVREAVSVRRSDRNLRCAGGRQLGVDLTEGELILFLDDDAEFEPGAVDLLHAEMRAHPEAAAVTATVTFPGGLTHHSGGSMRVSEAVAQFSLIGYGQPVAELPPSGPVGWVPGTAVMIRRDALRRVPLDRGMRAYYEDNEWCYRVQQQAPGSFRRLTEARAVHRFTPKLTGAADFASRAQATEHLEACAWFYDRHGKLLLDEIRSLVPELTGATAEAAIPAARLLLELVLARGGDWTLMQWLNGGLDVLLGAPSRTAALETELTLRAAEVAHHAVRESELERRAAEAHSSAAQLARMQGEIADRERELQALRVGEETLARILSGGWWQARQRALPALELYWRLRGRKRR